MELIDFTGIYQTGGKFLKFTGYSELADKLTGISEKTRKEGLLAIEDDLEYMDNIMMKKQFQLVVDGTDPEIVKNIGSLRLCNLLYTLKEILACAEFTLFMDAEMEFELYLASRDAASSAVLIKEMREQILFLRKGNEQGIELPERFRAVIDTVNSGIDCEIKKNIIENHICSILNINRIYNEVIIAGVLGVQAGDNPSVLREKLDAITGNIIQA